LLFYLTDFTPACRQAGMNTDLILKPARVIWDETGNLGNNLGHVLFSFSTQLQLTR